MLTILRNSRKAQLFIYSSLLVMVAYVLALHYAEVRLFADFCGYMSTAAMFYFGGQSAIDFMRAYKGETRQEAPKP